MKKGLKIKFVNNIKYHINNHLYNNINIYEKFSNNEENILEYNDYELNSMTYKDALKFDKRTYIQYYFSLLRTNHILVFAFISSNDYNSRIIKICIFFFSFALYYTVNGLFFTDSKIHEIFYNYINFH